MRYGSGLVFDTRAGLIVTAAHLIGDPSSITAPDHGLTAHTADQVAFDARIDVALLRVKTRTLPALAWASLPFRIGDEVHVAGRSPKLDTDVSDRGWLAAIIFGGRNLLQLEIGFQIGESGAAILNRAGDVIGMARVIVVKDREILRPGLAAPASGVRPIIDAMIAERRGRPN